MSKVLHVDEDVCAWRACGREPTLTYLGVGLCQMHWEKMCLLEGKAQMDMRRRLGCVSGRKAGCDVVQGAVEVADEADSSRVKKERRGRGG